MLWLSASVREDEPEYVPEAKRSQEVAVTGSRLA